MLRLVRVAAAAVFLASLPGCVYHHHHRPPIVHKGGPPPHAPAHGYRAKHRHRDVELAFDRRFGVYVVVGWHDHFFYQDRYYRFVQGRWQVSAHLDGKWKAIHPARLPKQLAKRSRRGHHPAKHKH